MFAKLNKIKNNTDAFNREGMRNLRNTQRSAYNCGGYALGTFSWYCPHTEAESHRDHWGWGWGSMREVERITEKCVKYMLADFSELRIIENVSELVEGEYAIAFRVSSEGDFHYVKRNSIGHWYHKRGGCPIIETMSTREVFSDCWCDMYDGPLVLFAKRS